MGGIPSQSVSSEHSLQSGSVSFCAVTLAGCVVTTCNHIRHTWNPGIWMRAKTYKLTALQHRFDYSCNEGGAVQWLNILGNGNVFQRKWLIVREPVWIWERQETLKSMSAIGWSRRTNIGWDFYFLVPIDPLVFQTTVSKRQFARKPTSAPTVFPS